MAKFNGDAPMLILMFIGVIIGVVFLGSIANQTLGLTSTQDIVNQTITMPVVNGTLDLTGRDSATDIIIYNQTGPYLSLTTGNFTLTSEKSATTGLQTLQLKTLDDSVYAGVGVNISYGFNPDGHVDGGTRTLTLLIIIFGALAVLLFVVASLFASGSSFSSLIRRN